MMNFVHFRRITIRPNRLNRVLVFIGLIALVFFAFLHFSDSFTSQQFGPKNDLLFDTKPRLEKLSEEKGLPDSLNPVAVVPPAVVIKKGNPPEDTNLAVDKPDDVDVQKLPSQRIELPKFTLEDIRGSLDADAEDPELVKRRAKVKEMAKHAWDNYVKYAWGHGELRPLSHTHHDSDVLGRVPLGATIVDSIDTLYIMGLEKEYEKASNWILNSLDFANAPTEVSVFEITIRFVGGLLSIYSMTQKQFYLDRAVSIVENLLPAFDTQTGLPYSLFNLNTKKGRNYQWASGCHILSEVGSLHMEFQYLSELTGDPKYSKLVHRIRDHLETAAQATGDQFYTHVGQKRGDGKVEPKFCNRHVTLSGEGDSFFEYLLKEWIRTGHADTRALDLYNRSLTAIEKLGLIRRSPGGSLYLTDSQYGIVGSAMGHLTCFAGGMFALGASKRDDSNVWFKRGRELTETCHKSYAQTETHLGPENFRFSDTLEAAAVSARDKQYILRPETVESYFYMWRLTHDSTYREYAWDAVQALEKHCRTDGGYTGLKDVTSALPGQDDTQQSFFLAETLKYLYLIFCDDSVLSLDRWVFNTEAHPLPIIPRPPSAVLT